MKMQLNISIPKAQYIAKYSVEIWQPNALFTPNTITKMPTFLVTFRNIVLQLWPVYSNADDADILFPVRRVPTSLWNPFSTHIWYWDTFPDAVMWHELSESFSDFWLRWFCLEGLISSPISLSQLTISLKPICFVHFLPLLSCATPLDETTITPSFCFIYLVHLHTSNTCTTPTIFSLIAPTACTCNTLIHERIAHWCYLDSSY